MLEGLKAGNPLGLVSGTSSHQDCDLCWESWKIKLAQRLGSQVGKHKKHNQKAFGFPESWETRIPDWLNEQSENKSVGSWTKATNSVFEVAENAAANETEQVVGLWLEATRLYLQVECLIRFISLPRFARSETGSLVQWKRAPIFGVSILDDKPIRVHFKETAVKRLHFAWTMERKVWTKIHPCGSKDHAGRNPHWLSKEFEPNLACEFLWECLHGRQRATYQS